MKKIRILIAEDHKLIRETWALLLNRDRRFEVIAACHDSSEAVCLTHLEKPQIVLMDINIMPINGFLATERILMVAPETKVIALSLHNDPSIIQKMFAAGAKGYVTKNSGYEEIGEAIVRVENGELFICSEIRDTGFEISKPFEKKPGVLDQLTNKEMEVSRYIKEGLRAKEISARMNISVRTVEVHRYNVLKKLCLKSSLALIHFLTTEEKKLEYS